MRWCSWPRSPNVVEMAPAKSLRSNTRNATFAPSMFADSRPFRVTSGRPLRFVVCAFFTVLLPAQEFFGQGPILRGLVEHEAVPQEAAEAEVIRLRSAEGHYR